MANSAVNPVIPPLPDPEATEIVVSQDIEDEKELWSEQAKQEIEDRKQDREERKLYAGKIYKLIVWWLIFIATLIVISNLTIYKLIEIPDSVMTTLIVSTTGSVLGIFVIVVKYLFHRS